MAINDLLGDLQQQILNGESGSNGTRSTSTYRMGGNGQWLIKKRANKRSASGMWSIDKDGRNGVEAAECGFFFIRRKRLTIHRDAQCDRRFQKSTDKLIGSRKGSTARASSLSGNRGAMEINAIASKTKKDGKTKSDIDIEMTFFSNDSLSNKTVSTPVNENYLENANYFSTRGLSVNQIEAINKSRIV